MHKTSPAFISARHVVENIRRELEFTPLSASVLSQRATRTAASRSTLGRVIIGILFISSRDDELRSNVRGFRAFFATKSIELIGAFTAHEEEPIAIDVGAVAVRRWRRTVATAVTSQSRRCFA